MARPQRQFGDYLTDLRRNDNQRRIRESRLENYFSLENYLDNAEAIAFLNSNQLDHILEVLISLCISIAASQVNEVRARESWDSYVYPVNLVYFLVTIIYLYINQSAKDERQSRSSLPRKIANYLPIVNSVVLIIIIRSYWIFIEHEYRTDYEVRKSKVIRLLDAIIFILVFAYILLKANKLYSYRSASETYTRNKVGADFGDQRSIDATTAFYETLGNINYTLAGFRAGIVFVFFGLLYLRITYAKNSCQILNLDKCLETQPEQYRGKLLQTMKNYLGECIEEQDEDILSRVLSN